MNTNTETDTDMNTIDNNTKRLALIFPGIGYHKDKPLLYYSTKLAVSKGYEIINIEYHDLPHKIRGDLAMMHKAAEMAYEQAAKQLNGIDFSQYEDVLFIGKSIGTAVLAKYVSDLVSGEHNCPRIRQIWYTPVEATFSFASGDIIAFIGDDDPWSDVCHIKLMASDLGIPLHSYPGCNHSLECDDTGRNIDILRDVMRITDTFI